MTQTTRLTATRRRAAVVAELVAQRATTVPAVAAIAAPGRSCRICADPNMSIEVDDALILKVSQRVIAERVGVNHKVVERHWGTCRMRSLDVCRASVRETRAAEEAARRGVTPPPAVDFATLVRDAAAAKLAKGELTVTAQHGLVAQGLLDRRDERRQDRDITLAVARLLSGASFGPPATVIDVTPNAPLSLPDPNRP